MGSYKASDARDGELGVRVPLFLIAMKKNGGLESWRFYRVSQLGIKLMENIDGEREREK